MLWFEGHGICILYRRLHRAVFELPLDGEGAAWVRIDAAALSRLLAGVPRAQRAHRRRKSDTKDALPVEKSWRSTSSHVTDEDVGDAFTVDERVRALEAQLARFAVDVAETAAKLRQVEEERDEYRKLVLHLREENERLRRGLVGQKAERLPQNDGRASRRQRER